MHKYSLSGPCNSDGTGWSVVIISPDGRTGSITPDNQVEWDDEPSLLGALIFDQHSWAEEAGQKCIAELNSN